MADTCSAWVASPEGQAMLWSWHLVARVTERHEREEGAGWGLEQELARV